MSKKDKGFVLIHRSLLDDRDLWQNGEPFSKGQAWVDLIMLAQHSEYRGTSRGSFRTSQMWLSKRWGWTRAKTRRFIDQLIGQGNITIDSTTNGTTVTLVNYEKYQVGRPTNDTTNSTTNRPTNRAQTNNVYTNHVCTSEDPDPERARIEKALGCKLE